MNLQNTSSSKSIDKNKGDMKEELSNLMNKLATIMNKNGEPFKARAYQKAEETIMSFAVFL